MTIKNTIIAIAFAATIGMTSIASAQFQPQQPGQQGANAGQQSEGIAGMFGPAPFPQPPYRQTPITGQRPNGQFGLQPIAQRPDTGQNPGNPAGGMQNSIAGPWYLSIQQEGVTMRARLNLDPSGQISFSMRVQSPEGQQQMDINAQWRMEGNRLAIIDEDGEVEYPQYQTDGQRFVLDLPEEGMRLGFTRNKEDARAGSFVQPIQQQQPQGYGGSSETGFDSDW